MAKAIGIIEGGGTGQELALIFKRIITEMYKNKKENIEFISFKEIFGYYPRTFWELKKEYYKKSYSEVRTLIDKEVEDILLYNSILLKKKAIGIFRTAINAETLYLLRKKVKVLKAMSIDVKVKDRTEKNIYFIRDQIQGFYANEDIKISDDKIEITSNYTTNNFNQIITFLDKKLQERTKKPKQIIFIYKYHIMGIELQKMIDKAMHMSKINIPYQIFQPDSGLHYLLSKELEDIAIVCGNEIGDTLIETLVHFYELGTKETMFTTGYLLDLENIEALQTMHGSADDLAGKNAVNPIATLRAGAYALENWLGIKGLVNQVEQSIQQTKEEGKITRDMGGNSTTSEVTNNILNLCMRHKEEIAK